MPGALTLLLAALQSSISVLCILHRHSLSSLLNGARSPRPLWIGALEICLSRRCANFPSACPRLQAQSSLDLLRSSAGSQPKRAVDFPLRALIETGQADIELAIPRGGNHKGSRRVPVSAISIAWACIEFPVAAGKPCHNRFQAHGHHGLLAVLQLLESFGMEASACKAIRTLCAPDMRCRPPTSRVPGRL